MEKHLYYYPNHAALLAVTDLKNIHNVVYCKNETHLHYDYHDYSQDYLTITSLEDNNVINFLNYGKSMSLSTSVDNGKTWNLYTTTESDGTFSANIGNLNNGQKLLIKAQNYKYYDTTEELIVSLVLTSGKFNLSGNIASLINGDLFLTPINNTCSIGVMFMNSLVVSAKNLVLSISNVANSGYESMFLGCTDLLEAPEKIQITTAGNSCLKNMFYECSSLIHGPKNITITTMGEEACKAMFLNCTKLVNSPILPTTTLTTGCYESMFSGCKSLKTTPVLSYQTLASSCYKEMFLNCSSLTDVPELPATTLAIQCYASMFLGCKNITTAPVLPATEMLSRCYSRMFESCTKLLYAPILPATTLANYCYEYMFANCTSLTTAPILSSTTLANNCYYSMFSGCTSLTTAPELPATTLVEGCYNNMFYNCANLNYIKAMFTTTPSATYTNNWVSGVSSTGIFIKNNSALWNLIGVNGTPLNWEVYNNNEAKLSIDKSKVVILHNYNENTYELPHLYNSENLPVTYSSSDPTKISINNSNGQITLNDYGTVTISINFAGNGTYPSKTLTYIIKYCYERPYEYQYFTFEALENDMNFCVYMNDDLYDMYYSIDNGINWVNLPTSESYGTQINTPTLNIGDKVMFKLSNEIGSSTFKRFQFSSHNKKFKAYGNIHSLLYGDNFIERDNLEDLMTYIFEGFFRESKIVDAENLILPATTLTESCYLEMFSQCSELVKAPELPATILADGCYNGMFSGCTKLQIAPELPATNLIEYCYGVMFNNCSSLNYIKCLATNIGYNNCLANWVNGVSANGTFIKASSMNDWTTGASGIPSGWTVQTASN